jgi:hypothetical protein
VRLRFGIAVLALIMLASGAAATARTKHTTKAHFGCTSEDEYEGLLIMAASSESSTQAAFQSELVKATLADKCTTFHAGEAVTVVTTHVGAPDPLLNGRRLTLVKIRFKGRGPRAWWTSPTVVE